MIASIDGVNRLIYLDASTVGVDFNTIDLYKEMRNVRENEIALRQYEIFLKSYGNLPKVIAKGTATERGVITQSGTKIVPFDTDQTLVVVTTIISDDGTIDGADCFDTSNLVNKVNIHYIPPQVEVITVSTGTGGVSSTDVNIISVAGEPVASIDEFKADTSLIPNYVWSYAVRELTVNPGLTPAQEIKIDNIQTSVIAVPDAVLDKVAP